MRGLTRNIGLEADDICGILIIPSIIDIDIEIRCLFSKIVANIKFIWVASSFQV